MLKYETIISEEKINVADLPKEIKQKINGIKMSIAKLEKNPTSAAIKDSVDRNDVVIADSIQTWLEKDLPAPKSDEEKLKLKEAADAAAKDEEKNKLDAATKEMANKIIDIMNADSSRCIEKTKLAEILGRTPAREEDIAGLRLYQVYLTQRYKKR